MGRRQVEGWPKEGELLRGKKMKDANLSLIHCRQIFFHGRHQEDCHQVAIQSPFTLSEHLRNACFFYVVGELRTKAEEGMFVSYSLAGVELSQTHCVLHTCAVFSPCFSQGFPLLFIYLFVLAALGLHCCAFSAAVSRGCSLWGCVDFSSAWLLLWRAWVLGCVGSSGCGTWA